MCGIGGWIGRQDGGSEAADRMRQTLHHQGERPDSVAVWTLATLVHTRLSIIDLSKTGAQPTANETGTIWSVFNGEIIPIESYGTIWKRNGTTLEAIPTLKSYRISVKGIDTRPDLQGSMTPQRCLYVPVPETVYPLPLAAYRSEILDARSADYDEVLWRTIQYWKRNIALDSRTV